MKIAYFGFDLFYDCLEQIKDSGNEVVKIFTCKVDGVYEFSDRVRRFASDNNIPITDEKVTPADIAQLTACGCELLFSAGYYFKIPIADSLIGVNIHPAILPLGRGPWPQPLTILKGLEQTGVTLHMLSSDFDCGDILLCDKFAVSPDENLETISEKYMSHARAVTRRFFENASFYIENALPQQGGEYWAEPSVEDMTFDIGDDYDRIDRVTRAFYGFGCYAVIGGQKKRIIRSFCTRSGYTYDDCSDVIEIDGGWLVVLKYA